MKWQITFRKYYRQTGWVSLAFMLALGTKLLLSSEANEASSKTLLLPPAQVATDLQKKPDHTRIGVSGEYFCLLPASKEKWLKSSPGTAGEIHVFALLPFIVHEFVQHVTHPVYHTLSIYQLNCCYRT